MILFVITGFGDRILFYILSKEPIISRLENGRSLESGELIIGLQKLDVTICSKFIERFSGNYVFEKVDFEVIGLDNLFYDRSLWMPICSGVSL